MGSRIIPSLNLYAYSKNNPVNFIDPTGKNPLLLGILLSFAFGQAFSNPDGTVSEMFMNGFTGVSIFGGMYGFYGMTKSSTSANSVQNNNLGRYSGMLRDATQGKGNFGIGSATRAEADLMGKVWVGNGYKVASDGRTLISADGFRQYRPPTFKPNLGATKLILSQRFQGR